MIPVGDTDISAVFLADDGDEIELHYDEFELRIEPANTATLTFTRTGFTGTLTGVAAGQTTFDLLLWHLEEMHEDFGPFPVAVTVQ